MAQYKVIQDIEAEDKLVGPLTLRQLIYAGVAALCLYICFLAYTKGAAFLIAFFLPLALAAGFFGFPWKGEQPTEIWALARLRFTLKPRVRIWDQDGVKDLVTVIAPKQPLGSRRPAKASMSQSEVRSRLKALADTIDSRGWATRNAPYGMYNQQWQQPMAAATPGAGNPLAAMIPNDDMFDDNNPVAQNFDAMLNKSEVQKRQRVLEQMAEAQNPAMTAAAPYQTAGPTVSYQGQIPQLPAPVMPVNMPGMPPPNMPQTYQTYGPQQPSTDYWFANGPAYPTAAPTPQPQLAAPVLPNVNPQPTLANTNFHIESDMPLASAATPTTDDLNMSEAIRQQNEAAMAINYGHMRVLQPTGSPAVSNGGVPINYQDSNQFSVTTSDNNPTSTDDSAVQSATMTRPPDPAILELANNDDLDIATIARQANKEIGKSPDEVEIRLH